MSDRSAPGPFEGRHVWRELDALPENVGVARGLVCALIDDDTVEPAQRDAVRLAVSEAVSNCVIHAYERAGGPIELFALRSEHELLLSVTDSGYGIAHETSQPGLGLGLRLIERSAAQTVLSSRATGGTSVQCRFVLNEPVAAL